METLKPILKTALIALVVVVAYNKFAPMIMKPKVAVKA